MSRMVRWVTKLTMTMFIVMALLKQCIRPVIVTKGFYVTGVSMHRLCLNDTANENRVYYLVRYNGYQKYNLAFKMIYQGPIPLWQTPLNDIDGIFVLDMNQHEISDTIPFYKGRYDICSAAGPDSVIDFGTSDDNMNERNERMKQKGNFSVRDFVFYVDKSAPQPYEIRMRLDSCVVRSRVKKDTVRWMFR